MAEMQIFAVFYAQGGTALYLMPQRNAIQRLELYVNAPEPWHDNAPGNHAVRIRH